MHQQQDNIRLLIADDEASIRNGLATAINWASHGITQVDLAADGEEACAMVRALQPDILITDIRMPGCSGLTLIERMREEGFHPHTIILSGYDDFSYAQRAIRSQITSYLLKPVVTADLLREVDTICDEIRAARLSGARSAAAYAAASLAQPALRQRFYGMLADGDYHSDTEIQTAAAALETPPIPCPCVAAVLRFTLPRKSDAAHFSQEDKRLFKTALRNVAEELAAGAYQIDYFSDSGNDVGLLLSPPAGAAQFLTTCIHTMRHISPLSLTAGLGSTALALLDVPASCRTAGEMVEYHLYASDTCVFESARLQPNSAVQPPRPPALPTLAEAVAAGDEDAIATELDAFFRTILYIPMPPPRYVRGMCAYLMSDIPKRVAALLQCDAVISLPSWPQEVEQLDSLQTLHAFLYDSLVDCARNLQKTKKVRMPAPIETAQAYIHQNVLSKLRVDDLAALVHLSESHFTALFKKSVGITAREYILECKLKKAKELLVHSDMSIFEIAEALEYGDYRSFSRAFKRFAGCSPTEYQQTITAPREKE